MSTNSVVKYIESLENRRRQTDSRTLIALMTRVTGHEARMWGDTMVGFDHYHYKYESGREGDSFLAGFSLRKQNLVIYITNGCKEYEPILTRLGKHKSSVSCLYVNKLDDVDLDVLEELISKSYIDMKSKNHTTPTRA